MASKDMKAMDLMIAPESIDDEIFGFHAQQAVEKSLKAWISVIEWNWLESQNQKSIASRCVVAPSRDPRCIVFLSNPPFPL